MIVIYAAADSVRLYHPAPVAVSPKSGVVHLGADSFDWERCPAFFGIRFVGML
jgi:hypothetical protein